ncbi:MAG: YdhR family protein, partial [FCB group bacterium]|nr:YdhR family protein [FCB group bacterium]
MSERMLLINFKFNVSRGEYEQAAASLAGAFAEVPGLRWKIWT